MSEMVDRVALALSLHDYDGRIDRVAARDAIEAMREPTEQQLFAAHKAARAAGHTPFTLEQVRAAYAAIIDAA